MQLIALIAMETPVGFEADLIRDEKVKVYRSFRPMDEKYIEENTVSGQYGPGEINGEKVKRTKLLFNRYLFFSHHFWRKGIFFYLIPH